MPDIIIISTVELLNDELGIKQDKTTEQEQAKVELKLIYVCVCDKGYTTPVVMQSWTCREIANDVMHHTHLYVGVLLQMYYESHTQ